MEFKVGDKVYFGRPSGEQTEGEIVKANPRKYKVKQLEPRLGNGSKTWPIGTVWTVPGEFLTPAVDAEGKALLKRDPRTHRSSAPERGYGPPTFRAGDSIQFKGKGKVLKGTVSKVNRSTYSVTVPGESRGWKVPFELASAAT